MKNLKIVIFLVLVVLAIAVAAIYSIKPNEIVYNGQPAVTGGNEELVGNTDNTADKVSNTTSGIVESTTKFDSLFMASNNSDEYSNIVGTLANESFAWYVPGWLVENWDMTESEGKGHTITFTPKGTDLTKISPITFYFEPSSETFNAVSMYEGGESNKVLIKEVLLSQHKEGMLQILIESETRIYHIQSEGINEISDTYMIDGNGYTLRIVFSADKDIFYKYADKVRDMVKGIAEVKAPQG